MHAWQTESKKLFTFVSVFTNYLVSFSDFHNVNCNSCSIFSYAPFDPRRTRRKRGSSEVVIDDMMRMVINNPTLNSVNSFAFDIIQQIIAS